MYRVNKPLPYAPSRRSVLLGVSALAASAAFSPAFAGVDGFVDSVWKRAKARGVSRRVFDIAMGGFTPSSKVVDLSKKQPEFVSTAADYIGKRVTDGQAAKGQDMRGEWAQTLAAVSSKYGVQPEIMLAVWGIETNYGGYMGGTNTVHALATLAYSGYRADYFGSELVTALEILEGGHVRFKNMVGSWASAMGQPQFMPSSFMKYAVDFKGDGHKDIWGSVPDALASIGNYLRSFGWRPGETWGYEVRLPKDFNYQNVWTGINATLGDWSGVGVMRASGKAFPARQRHGAALHADGWQRADLRGAAELRRDQALQQFGQLRAGRRPPCRPDHRQQGFQHRLAERHCAHPIRPPAVTGDPAEARLRHRQPQRGDGPKTRAAVMDWQARSGLLADGHVSGNLLRALS